MSLQLPLRSAHFLSFGNTSLFKGTLFDLYIGGDKASVFIFSNILLCGSLVFSAMGVAARTSAVLSLLSFINLYLPTDIALKPYDTNIIFFNLFAIIFFPKINLVEIKSEVLSCSMPAWPGELIKLNLALVYFSAFLSKIINSGGSFSWAYGETMQGYLYERHLFAGNNFALFVSSSIILCQCLSWGALIAESTFWGVLFGGKLEKFLVVTGLLMHMSIYLLMSIDFRCFVASYLIFIPYEKIFQKMRKFTLLA